jgi:hypothetical protein
VNTRYVAVGASNRLILDVIALVASANAMATSDDFADEITELHSWDMLRELHGHRNLRIMSQNAVPGAGGG